MPTMTILRGLPGSGKSTFAKAIAAASNGKVVRLNRDDFREGLFGTTGERGVLSHEQERRISEIEQYLAREAIAFGSDVIIDALNLKAEFVKHWISLGEEMGAEVVFNDEFLHLPIEEVIRRDLHRAHTGGRSVGASVIRDIAQRYNINPERNKYPAQPVVQAKAEVKFPVYNGTPGKPKAVIVDIDGTVALMQGIRGPFEWHRVGEDAPNIQVIQIVNQLFAAGNQIIFVSGRDAVCRQETMDWLEEWFNIPFSEIILLMRPADDMRDDTVVKNEIFERDIRDQFDVQLVLDDRNKVVKMWRSKGLTCLQVAEGNF